MPVLRQPIQEQERGRATPKLAPRPATQLVVLGTDGLRAGVPRQPYQAGRGRHMRLLRGRIPANRAKPWGHFGPGLGGAHPPPPGHAQVPRVQLEQKVLSRRPLSAASQAQPRRHEREVDQHARKRLHAGGGSASTDEMRATMFWRGMRLLNMGSGVLLQQYGARREVPVATSGRTWFWALELCEKVRFPIGTFTSNRRLQESTWPKPWWTVLGLRGYGTGGRTMGRVVESGRGSCRTGILEDWECRMASTAPAFMHRQGGQDEG